MTDEHQDRESLSLLGELWETPVGRRWVLKAGLASAATLGVELYGGRAAAAPRTAKPLGRTDLHFALASLSGVSDLVLVANGTRIPLAAHTRTSRTALRRSDGLWQAADLTALTHFAPAVDLPADRGMLLSVHGRRGSEAVVVSQIWHVPASATLALARAVHRLTGSVADVVGSSHRLHRLRIPRHRVHLPSEVALLDMVGGTDQTAIALTMSHPNIATIAPTETAVTKALLAQTPEVQTLGTHIAQMQRAGRDFATMETAVDPDGSPSEIVIGQTTTTFQTFHLNQQDAGLTRTLRSALAAGVTGVRDKAQLGAVIDKPLDQDRSASTKTWVQPEGVVPRATTYKQGRKRAGVDIKVKNPGLNFGTYVTVNGSYANGKVPLKLYNNYVRWVSVYVQYLGKDGTNLSADPSPTGDDTKYSQYLGLLPQVFTVLGVPLWDTNTIEVSLEFPPGSHVARLLLCGLGSNIEDGGWRQYFPADAYPGPDRPNRRGAGPGAAHRHLDDRPDHVRAGHLLRHCSRLEGGKGRCGKGTHKGLVEACSRGPRPEFRTAVCLGGGGSG